MNEKRKVLVWEGYLFPDDCTPGINGFPIPYDEYHGKYLSSSRKEKEKMDYETLAWKIEELLNPVDFWEIFEAKSYGRDPPKRPGWNQKVRVTIEILEEEHAAV